MKQEILEPTVTKSNDIINTLTDNKLRDIIRLVFIDQLTDEEIAKHSGMSKPTLYKLKKTERYQKAMKDYAMAAVREADVKIQTQIDKAVDRLISLLDSNVPSIQLRASIELIRLAGLGQPLPIFTPDQPHKSDQMAVLEYLKVIALKQGKANDPISG